jgi:hypothetical protein
LEECNSAKSRIFARGKRSFFAYQAGVQGGRPRVVDWDKVVKLREASKSLKEIAAEMHCSVGTVCRIMRENWGGDA